MGQQSTALTSVVITLREYLEFARPTREAVASNVALSSVAQELSFPLLPFSIVVLEPQRIIVATGP